MCNFFFFFNIMCFYLRVSLSRVTSSTLVTQSGAGDGSADGEVEMKGMNQVAKQDREDRVIQWQQKVFSQVRFVCFFV